MAQVCAQVPKLGRQISLQLEPLSTGTALVHPFALVQATVSTRQPGRYEGGGDEDGILEHTGWQGGSTRYTGRIDRTSNSASPF